MHSLPNQSSIRRFRFAAVLLLLRWLLFYSSLGMLAYSIAIERRDLACVAMGLFGIALFIWVSHWVISRRARCPLCFVPSFSHQLYARSNKAKHFLGSYSLFVAICVIFKGRFRCPYCGEPTALEVRQRNARFSRAPF
jgi:hypothetical protein